VKSGKLFFIALPCAALWLALASGRAAGAEKLVVWDGEDAANGNSWVAPKKDTNYFKAQDKDAHSGKTALELRAEGEQWMGGGWNWHGWWPEDSGDDISGFRNLTFWIKVTGRKPASLTVALNCSSTKKPTAALSILDYSKDAADGQWHEVVIPMEDFAKKEKTEFDPKKAWEIDLGTWAQEKDPVSLFIDDIAFDNRPAK